MDGERAPFGGYVKLPEGRFIDDGGFNFVEIDGRRSGFIPLYGF